jgi:hypothetical protein
MATQIAEVETAVNPAQQVILGSVIVGSEGV